MDSGRTQHVRSLCHSVLVTLLTACATPILAPPDRAYSGRFAVTTALGEQRENVSGRFNLEIRGSQQIVELASPLGTTVARVEIEPGGARATGAQMQEVRGADADMLTQQLLGWPLPVSGLVDWIEGRPVPTRVARVERRRRTCSVARTGRLDDSAAGVLRSNRATASPGARAPGCCKHTFGSLASDC